MEAICIYSSHTVCWAQDEDQRGRSMQLSDADILLRTKNGLKAEQHPCFQVDTDGAVLLVARLKFFSEHADLHNGVLLHADVVKRGLLEINPFVGTTLVNMYAKCGALIDACRVFNELPALNVVAWNALLTGYAQNGHGEKALECFDQMQCAGLSPDSVTFACILNVCGSIGALDRGQQVHAQIVRERILDRNILVANALIDMYAKCGLLENALEVFDELSVRSVVSWTALIAGYANYGHGEEALVFCDRMQHEGFSPNAVTIVCILKACGSICALDKGHQFHAKSVREGLLDKNILVANALIDMYIKCDVIVKAEEVFYAIPLKDVVSWTALIAGLAQHGHGKEALSYFNRMLREGYTPNAVTYACALKACGSIGAIEKGQELHKRILEHIFRDKDKHFVGIALVDMYAKCGALAMAQSVFDKLPDKGVVLWNALMSGYAQYGYGEQVLDLCEQMYLGRLISDAVTYACTLKACSTIGAAYKGQELHAEITRVGLLEKDNIIGNALLDMYANCGMPAEAQEVFKKLLNQDVVSWNALIAGYAYLGNDDIVFDIFERMKRVGDEPNMSTFSILLSTCSHRGLLNEGQSYYESMIETYDTIPTLQHHTCMIDLFSRAGCLDEAVAIIERMPFFADLSLCLTLLGASQQWGSLKLGNWAFEQAAHLNGKGAAAYVCMSNVYAAGARQEECDNVKGLTIRKQVWTRVLQLACA